MIIRLPERNLNKLLMWFVGLNAAYWAFGFAIYQADGGGRWWSAFIAAFLICGGIILSGAVMPEVIAILKRGVVGKGEIAVIGAGMVSSGMVYTGLFSMIFNHFGRPQAWIGPLSAYGLACTAVGLVLFAMAPEASTNGLKAPRWWIIVGSALMIAAMGFYFGIFWSSDTAYNNLKELPDILRSTPR